jgi:uncharacterized repeat protein (TIGR03803 family)
MKISTFGGHVGRLGLFLVAALIAATSFSSRTAAQTLTTLYSFTGGSDGATPLAGLIFDAAGNLYGTASDNLAPVVRYGTVFKLTPPSTTGGSWTQTVLHSFAGTTDGAGPYAGLVFDAAGNLYGTTSGGGQLDYYPYRTYGTVFKLSPPSTAGGTWTESVLHKFTGSDGANPYAGLIFDATGNLYGTTFAGGVFGGSCPNGCGTVFSLTPPSTMGGPWSESVLYAFTTLESTDGVVPAAELILDASGNLYGTTTQHGTGYYGDFPGMVFKLTPPSTTEGTWTETALHIFNGLSASDGAGPWGSLIADGAGNLYGTTYYTQKINVYGPYVDCCGTVFRLTPTGDYTALYSFAGGSDGANPRASLVVDAAGNLYGTTVNGGGSSGCGPYGCGTVFKLAPPSAAGGSWTETVLYRFTGGSDGAHPLAGLTADAGNLYGTTSQGGAGGCGSGSSADPINGCGTVFKLSMPAVFAGVPGQTNCFGQSVSFLSRRYGGIAHAAASLGYASVMVFQKAVAAYCGH